VVFEVVVTFNLHGLLVAAAEMINDELISCWVVCDGHPKPTIDGMIQVKNGGLILRHLLYRLSVIAIIHVVT
jgi:hypothetical protein